MSSTTNTHLRAPHAIQVQDSSEAQSRSPHVSTLQLYDTEVETRSPHMAHSDTVRLVPSDPDLNEQIEVRHQYEQQRQLHQQMEYSQSELPSLPPQYQDLHPQPSPILVSVTDHFIDNGASPHLNRPPVVGVQDKNQGLQGVAHVQATPLTFISSANNRRQCCTKRVKIAIAVLLVMLAIFLAVMLSTVWKPKGNPSSGASGTSGPGTWGACKPGGCLNYQVSCYNNCTTNDPTYKSCLVPCKGDFFCEAACQNPANNPCINTCSQNVLACLRQCGV